MSKEMMKAAVYHGIRDVRVEEVEKPVAGKGEILLKIKAATTCGTDVKQFNRGYATLGDNEVRLFGHECAGVVEAVGEGVTKFKVGDRIVAHNSYPCGHCYWCKREQYSMCENLGFRKGGFCEYTVIPEPLVNISTFAIPENVSFAEAAMIEPLSCAVYGVDQADIQLGDYVIINGAGPLGLYMIKCAYLKGAKVISCDFSKERLEVAKRLGAWKTVRLGEGIDQIKAVRALIPEDRGADVVIEAVGKPEVWEMALQMVRKGGTVVWFGGCKGDTSVNVDTKLMHYSQLTVKGIFHTTPKHVEMAFNMIVDGEIKGEDFLGKEYKLDDVVEALDSHARQEAIKNVILFD